MRRVEIPVHYDLWMRGARVGTVVESRPDHIKVSMDHPQVRRLVKIPRADFEYLKELK